MSYSYVKAVFPNFEYSNVYNSKVYENLNVSKEKREFLPADLPSLNSTFSDVSVFEEEKPSKSKIETFQDNQKFFNQPLPKDVIPPNNNRIHPERFEQPQRDNGDHLEYTKHILECGRCKDLLMKQFGMENERIRNEEIMELISFVIFALFILLLIDFYAKK